VDTTTPQIGGYLQILLLLAFLIPAVLFLVSQQNILKAIKPENRRMHPGLVWLQLIPLWGQIWQFFVVTRIANAFRNELASKEEDSILGFSDTVAVEVQGKRPTFAIGIAYCILYTTGILMNLTIFTNASNIAMATLIFLVSMLGGMICWIIYWVQLTSYKRKLKLIAG
jgi:hypothetical protein